MRMPCSEETVRAAASIERPSTFSLAHSLEKPAHRGIGMSVSCFVDSALGLRLDSCDDRCTPKGRLPNSVGSISTPYSNFRNGYSRYRTEENARSTYQR